MKQHTTNTLSTNHQQSNHTPLYPVLLYWRCAFWWFLFSSEAKHFKKGGAAGGLNKRRMICMRDIQELIRSDEAKSVFSVRLGEYIVILYKLEEDYFSEYDFWTESSYLVAKGKDEGVQIFIEQVELMFNETNDYILYGDNYYKDEQRVEKSKEEAQEILEWLEVLQRNHDDYAEYIEKHSRKLTAYLTELISN